MEQDKIKQLIDALTSPESAALISYTKWVITSALIWIAMSCGAFVTLYRWKIEDKKSDGFIIRAVLIAFTVVVFGVFLIDLIEPNAKAIHHLITDIIQ